MAGRLNISTALLLITLTLVTLALGAPATESTSSATFVKSPDDASWTAIARCALEPKSPLDCVEQRSKRAVDIILENERKNSADSRAAGTGSQTDDQGDAFDKDVEHLVDHLSEMIADAAGGALERRLRGVVTMRSMSKSRGDTENVEEGRGKKKKKLRKLIQLLKLVILIVLVKLKLAFILMKLQTLFQLKLVIMTAIILAIQKLQLWSSFKSKHDPQKVIYYEHAQHQHHYDDSHWHGDHHEPQSSGWSLWGRSYDEATRDSGDPQRRTGHASGPTTVSFPGLPGIQSGIYRAADGTRLVIGQPASQDPQDLAYSAHRRR